MLTAVMFVRVRRRSQRGYGGCRCPPNSGAVAARHRKGPPSQRAAIAKMVCAQLSTLNRRCIGDSCPPPLGAPGIGGRQRRFVGWLVGHERKSQLNGASYLHTLLGYYGTLLLWEQEAKSYSVIHHHGDRFFVMAAICDGGPFAMADRNQNSQQICSVCGLNILLLRSSRIKNALYRSNIPFPDERTKNVMGRGLSPLISRPHPL